MNTKRLLSTLIVVLFLHASADCQLYIEGYGGGLFGFSDIAYLKTKNTYGITGLKGSFDIPTKQTASTFIGGLKFGLWLDTSGYLKVGGPSFLKHLGFYLDVGLNSLDYHHSLNAEIHYTQDHDVHSSRADISLSSKGFSETLACMFVVRANCFKTKKIPAGQLQPYLGIGPSLLFTDPKIKLTVYPHTIDDNNFLIVVHNPYTIKPKHRCSKAALSLSLDAGLRHMVLHNLSFDYSFKYRFAPMSFNYHNNGQPISIKHRYDLFSFQLGVGYHF